MDTQSIVDAGTNAKDCVSERGSIPLTFTAVDGLGFAAAKGRLASLRPKTLVAADIGPLVELIHLARDGALPSLERATSIALSQVADFYGALQENRRYWICSITKQLGFFHTINRDEDVSNLVNFGQASQRAAINAGLPKQVARQLAAAIMEMLDNIYLHSGSSETGFAAFQARPGYFEFVISDRGMGVLQSLKGSSEYAALVDHGDALQLALTDGCSRYGSNSNHGHGFRPLFVGLSNLNCALRFRSGDHALTIDGRNPQCIPWRKIAKPKISGFLAAISCQRNFRR
jgi:hypothetical protein